MARIDPANVQGIVFQLYRYPLSRHLLFRVTDPTAARAFLRKWVARVTHAAVDLSQRPEPLINIGVSWTGLAALGVIGAIGTESATSAFPAEYRGAPPPDLAGDWNGRFASIDIHLTVHLHCMNEAKLIETTAALRADAAGLVELTPVENDDHSITGKALGGSRLHFGFQDGISQPAVKWDDATAGGNLIDFRHFLLGYASRDVQSSPSSGPWADLVRDGTYGAFQWIHQDVAAFESFLTRNAAAVAPSLPLADARELLAAKMMGRWRNGTPTILSPDRPDDSKANATEFSYLDDPLGDRCPLTAHVRVANRRDQPLTPVVEPTFRAGGPHLLRRGMAYGPELQGEQDDGVDRGLVGMFLCANLRTQFFTVMHWVNKTDFSTVFDTDRLRWQDMMMGDRSTPGAVTKGAIRTAQGEILLNPLPRFIKIKGTALLLILGMTGLQRIAQEPS
jgi:deferrochelatase/peroxidase EfeB